MRQHDYPPLCAERQKLVEGCIDLAYSLAKRHRAMFNSQEEADDAAMDDLLGAAARYDFRPGTKFVTYAHWCISMGMKSTAKSLARARRVRAVGVEMAASRLRATLRPGAAPEVELSEAAERLLASLPPRWRQAVEMHVMRGLALHETGAELGVTRTRAGQLVERGLKAIRNREGLAA
jgi:RNA polymerase sigma factor (sigma-70 family)